MLKTKYNSFGGHEFTDESVTIPDQSISISEILNRYAVGRDVPVMRGAMYDGSDAFEDDPLRVPGNDIVDNEEQAQRIADIVRSEQRQQDTVDTSRLQNDDGIRDSSNSKEDSNQVQDKSE